MNEKLHIIILGVAAVLVGVSLLNPGGLLIGALIGLAWLVLTYGGHYGLKLKANRDMGANSRGMDVRDLPSIRDKDGGGNE